MVTSRVKSSSQCLALNETPVWSFRAKCCTSVTVFRSRFKSQLIFYSTYIFYFVIFFCSLNVYLFLQLDNLVLASPWITGDTIYQLCLMLVCYYFGVGVQHTWMERWLIQSLFGFFYQRRTRNIQEGYYWNNRLSTVGSAMHTEDLM